MENIITRMRVVQKGAGTARLKAELEQTIEEGVADGSVMEGRVGCSVVCGPEEIKIRLAEQTCIFNAEAIIEAIKATRRFGIVKRIVITDILSNIMAQETLYTKGNSKKTGFVGRRGLKPETNVGAIPQGHHG
jgi:hypothetical protein